MIKLKARLDEVERQDAKNLLLALYKTIIDNLEVQTTKRDIYKMLESELGLDIQTIRNHITNDRMEMTEATAYLVIKNSHRIYAVFPQKVRKISVPALPSIV